MLTATEITPKTTGAARQLTLKDLDDVVGGTGKSSGGQTSSFEYLKFTLTEVYVSSH
jgi:hypothetical protein